MLAFRNLGDGRVFVEANQPPAVTNMAPAGTVGTTLDESDLGVLLEAVRRDDTDAVLVIDVEVGESLTEKLTADRSALAGER